MASSTPELPTLFLSHSGKQKGFVWSLYRELLHINHSPFFDQDSGEDSLPRGSRFASRIIEACRACKLGLVVLSHEYIESLWPMLELQQLLFHNSNEPENVYPIFYELEPADLSNEENLKRWRSFWQKHEVSWHAKLQNLLTVDPSTSASGFQPILDISSWPKALEMLRSRSGDIRPNNKDDHTFVQTIVSNICKRFPPPQSFFMDDSFKGADHIPQEIHKLFQEQEERREGVDCRTPIVVGMHGVGGAGKTTVCKYMVNFYSKEYPGSCCFLQFPTKEEDESKSLVQSMKDILSARGSLTKDTLDSIKTVDQAMFPLQELLRRYKVFLILDNVWDWALQIVKQVVTMEFKPESRLLVTARSADLLERLSKEVATMSTMKIVHVPSISEEEAVEALKAYSWMSSQFSIRVEDLRGLARSCCFGDRCHPLLLKAVGARLRHVGVYTHSTQDWARIISRLQADIKYGDGDLETNVVNVLKTSFEALRSQLKDTFLKLGTCIPQFDEFYHKYSLEGKLCDWLRMISSNGSPTVEDIRNQLMELKYHGLVEIQEGKVMFHDLQMKLIENVVQENNGEPRCFLFCCRYVKTLSAAKEWTKLKYIYGKAKYSIFCETSERRWLRHINGCFLFGRRVCMSPSWQCIEVLQLQDSWHQTKTLKCGESFKLSVKHMQSLRHLLLNGFSNLKEVGGWHGATNLISVKLTGCNLQKVESMTCLCRLESLVIPRTHRILEGADDLAAFLGHLPELRELNLSGCRNNWLNLGMLSANCPSLQRCDLRMTEIVNFPSLNLMQLRVLSLSCCERLQSLEGSVCNLTALEELCLLGCEKLERIPDLKLLVNLRVLELRGCRALKEVKVGEALSLSSLDLEDCEKLERIQDLKLLVNLKYLDLHGCKALKEVKVGDAAVTSLEHLLLNDGYYHLSTLSCSPLPISAFTNLRRLEVWGDEDEGSSDFLRMEKLPVSLERLRLFKFDTGHEITHLSRLLNLRYLEFDRCAFLTSLTGLSVLPNLEELSVSKCASLTSITGLSVLPNFKELRIQECASLRSITGLSALPNFKELCIQECASLRSITGLSALPNFEELHIQECLRLTSITCLSTLLNLRSLDVTYCPRLTSITGLAPLTNLQSLEIQECESLREVGHWEPPFDSYHLQRVYLTYCPQLETHSTMRHLPSSIRFWIVSCPLVKKESLPEGAMIWKSTTNK